MSTVPTGRGKRVLRFFLFSVLTILAFFVLVFISSRVATDSVFRGIESSRATGLSSYMQLGSAQSFGDDLQIVRKASLVLGTQNFEAVRGRIASVIQDHQGRLEELQVVTASQGSGRTLLATVRVPAEQFDSTLAQLKALGNSEQESQTSSESSATESDRLDAKLASAQITEDRLSHLSSEHAGKLGEYLEVEREIAKVRGEIEDLQAQQRRRAQRVQYATIRISLKEEYAARFDLERVVMSARLRSSVVDGLQGVVGQGASMLAIMLLFGPSLLFWAALLYWPVRFGWRRGRAILTARNTAGHNEAIQAD